MIKNLKADQERLEKEKADLNGEEGEELKKLEHKIQGVRQYQQTYEQNVDMLIKNNQFNEALLILSQSRTPPRGTYYPEGYWELRKNVSDEISGLQKESAEAVKKAVIEIGKDITDQLEKATQSEDLDDLFVKLDEAMKSVAMQTREFYKEKQEIENYRSIIGDWQEYLLYKSRKDAKNAQLKLRNVERNLMRTPIIKRSKVLNLIADIDSGVFNDPVSDSLEKKEEMLTAEQLIQKYTSVHDLHLIIDKTNHLLSISTSSSSVKEAKSLNTLARSYRAVFDHINQKNINIGLMRLNGIRPSTKNQNWATQIKEELKALALNKLVPEDMDASSEGESALSQIMNITQYYQKKKDYYATWEFLSSVKSLLYANSSHVTKEIPWLQNDIDALESYISAKKYQDSGEYYTALTKYKRVLDQTGRFGPYEEAQFAIKTIKEKHFEEVQSEQAKYNIQKDKIMQTRMAMNPRMSGRNYNSQEYENDMERVIIKVLTEKLPIYLEKMSPTTSSSNKEVKK